MHLVPAPPARQRLVAKYAYDANVNSPLGQNAELDLCAADKMKMIATHPSQELWWLVEMDDGRRGYVPSTYVMVCFLFLTASCIHVYYLRQDECSEHWRTLSNHFFCLCV